MNPYEVLGVSETATDEQVRSAYIKLVKKYHPDRYQDSDLKDLANDKLKQVNEAYDTITNMRKNGSASQNTYSGSGFGGYSGSSSRTSSGGYSGNYGSGYSGNFSAEFARVRQCINTSSLYEAQAILDGIPLHNAEWHYLYGIVCFRGGDYSSARNYLDRAVSMEPGNAEYRRARELPHLWQRRYGSNREHGMQLLFDFALCGFLLRMHGRRSDSLLLIFCFFSRFWGFAIAL